jgi:uncharacterized coiled-coil protein SlyX
MATTIVTNAGGQPPKNSASQEASEEILSALNDLLAQQDFELSIPYNHLNAAVAKLVDDNGKIIAKLQSKIVKGINKEIVGTDNHLDKINTLVLNGLNAHQDDIEFLLQQLAVKSGAIKVGDPLTSILLQEVTDSPELAFDGRLVMAAEQMGPWLKRIAIALEMIALKMPGLEAPPDLTEEPEQVAAEDAVDTSETTSPVGYWK